MRWCNWPLFLAVVLSGAGSLMYQLAWTRRLASITSATHTAQAVVLAVFMTGLAVGAYLGGRLSRRAADPLGPYAWIELIAACFAGISVLVIPASGVLRSLPAADGSGLWLQLAAVALFLLCPTTLLGATLPLVIEHCERRHGGGRKRQTTRVASLLYGWNTAGAAGGCLLAGYVTIELLGLAQTIYCGMVCALAAAVIATVLRARTKRDLALLDTRPAAPAAADGPIGATWLWAAGLAGFTALAAEVLWSRLVSLVVPNTVYVLAQVLAAVLIGIALGAGLAGRLIRSRESPASLQRAAAYFLALGAVALGLVPIALLRIAVDEALTLELASGLFPQTAILVLVLIPAATLIGAILPLLVGVLQRAGRSARTFGSLYAANTIGGVLGSLAMGFALLPGLGSGGSGLVLQISALALCCGLLLSSRASLRAWAGIACAAGTVGAVAHFTDIPRDLYEARLEEGAEILELWDGPNSVVMVSQHGQDLRRLWLNSSWVAATGGGHRVLGHLPALFVERPRRALGIALGTGQTFASILRHGVTEFHCVELDRGVIELSGRWFSEANDGLLEKPEVVVYHDDGRAFMRSTVQRFDVVILEPLQSWTIGTTNLYTREFYEEARAVLQPDGVLAQWVPFYGQSPRDTKAMVRTALEVFPDGSLWLDDRDGIVVLFNRPFSLAPAELAARVEKRGIAAELGRNAVSQVSDLLSLFLMGPQPLRQWFEGVPLLTDDHPFLEFSAARRLGAPVYRRILATIVPYLDDPGAYSAAEDRETLSILAEARAIRRSLLQAKALPDEYHAQRASALESGLALAPGSSLLQKRYRQAILSWAESTRRKHGDPAAMERIYRRGLARSPGLGEAAVELAILYGDQGRFAEAYELLERASTAEGVGDSVERVRQELRAVERGLHGDGRPPQASAQ